MEINTSLISDLKKLIYNTKEGADYGNFSMNFLSAHLQPEFDNGFLTRDLFWYQQFCRTFPIANALRTQFSLTHYRLLLSVANQYKREYHIAETANKQVVI